MNTRHQGFTLIELLVVMAIVAILLTVAMPRYFQSVDRSREAVLKKDLSVMRDAIDKYYGDTGQYPERLEDLVDKRYLRRLPVDPITESTSTWITSAPEDPSLGSVYDVHSGATGVGRDGTAYKDW